jgi:hypothetical protein
MLINSKQVLQLLLIEKAEVYSASVSLAVPLLQIDEAHMWVGGDRSPCVLNWKCV